MTFGKIIAYNRETDRGIIEDRFGQTWKFETMSIVADHEHIREGVEVGFETMEASREAYAIETIAGGFKRYDDVIGKYIS